MDWKVLLLFIFILSTTATQAGEKRSKSATLQLRGVVPLQVGVRLVTGQNGAVVPTLKSNAPITAQQSIRLKTTRSPASVDDFHRIVIESD